MKSTSLAGRVTLYMSSLRDTSTAATVVCVGMHAISAMQATDQHGASSSAAVAPSAAMMRPGGPQ